MRKRDQALYIASIAALRQRLTLRISGKILVRGAVAQQGEQHTEERMKTVDMHSHVVPREIIEAVRAAPQKYKAAFELTARGERISRPGKTIPFTAEFHDAGAKIESMERKGIDISAISPGPQVFFYWLDAAVAIESARIVNDGIAAMCAQYPARLKGMMTLPMQDPDAAIAEMERVKRAHGFPGIELGTSVETEQLADARFRKVLKRAQELKLIIFAHPYGVGLAPSLDCYYLTNLIGNPLNTVIMAAHLMFSGALDELPELKWVLAHGGGYLPYQLGRLVHGQKVRNEPKQHTGTSPYQAVKHFWFDALTHNPQALRFLIDLVGAERVVLGTDAAFDMGEEAPLASLDAVPGLTSEERDRISSSNALGLLGQ